MINIDIRTQMRAIERSLDALTKSARERVIDIALNDVARKASVEMRRRITAEYAIKASEVRSQIYVKNANAKQGRLWAEIEAFPRRRGKVSRNVILFSAKQTRLGVTVRIKKSSGRKLIRHAFIANKGRTVFIREEDTPRLPIKPVETIDVPQMFNAGRINSKVIAKIKRDLPSEVERMMAVAIEKGWT
ncbi:MAG: phage tail protein [Betaproteobacteria bacterium]|nr:phage tail protein [Betaproteobacteria bacterium]